MLRTIALGLGALIVTASVAHSADDISPPFDWSGTSVAVFAGYFNSDYDQTELFSNDPGGSWWFPPGPNPGNNYNVDGGFAGLMIDHNWQRGALVGGLGVEVGGMALGKVIEDPNSPPIPFPGPSGPVTTLEDSFFSSLTGRVGFASGRMLGYVRGGVSLLKTSATTVDECARSFCGQLTIEAEVDEALFGVTGGAGIEYALTDRAIIGAEYRAYQFEDFRISGVASNNLVYSQTVDPGIIHTIRVTLGVKF